MTITKSGIAILAGTLLCLLPALIPSCTHDPVGIQDLEKVYFNPQVYDILFRSCGMTGCHDGSAEGFLIKDTTDYQSIKDNYVVPGDPRGSKLYNVITDINGENMMPPDIALTKEQRTIIQVWIAQGALEKK